MYFIACLTPMASQSRISYGLHKMSERTTAMNGHLLIAFSKHLPTSNKHKQTIGWGVYLAIDNCY